MFRLLEESNFSGVKSAQNRRFVMKNLTKVMVSFLKDEEGATMVEYGLMVALIAIVAMVGAALLGDEVNTVFTEASTAISGAGE